MVKKILMASISMICTSVLSARPDLPTNEKIGEVCAYTNSPALIQDFVISFMTNIWWDSTSYTTEEIERVQTCLYSNVIAYTKANVLTNQVYRRIGDSNHLYLMRVVFAFPCFRDNIKAINEIADYIGTIHFLTEQEYMSKIKAAVKTDLGLNWDEVCRFVKTNGWGKIKEGENYKQTRKDWGAVWENRYQFSTYRNDLLIRIRNGAVRHWRRTLTAEEFMVMQTNFVWRAKLTEEEKVIVFGSGQ